MTTDAHPKWEIFEAVFAPFELEGHPGLSLTAQAKSGDRTTEYSFSSLYRPEVSLDEVRQQMRAACTAEMNDPAIAAMIEHRFTPVKAKEEEVAKVGATPPASASSASSSSSPGSSRSS